MIDRFTEKARSALGYALHEARQRGNFAIEPIYLVLGLAQVNTELFQRLGIGEEEIAKLRETLPPAGEPITPTTPTANTFSKEMSAVLAQAAREAEMMGHRPVGTGHVLLGIISEDAKIRSEFDGFGVTLNGLRKTVAEESVEPMMGPEHRTMMSRYIGRSGIGYDLHRLEAGRKLMIGGVHVPFDKGPVGHSDGDVLAHAICDALLGAASLGDIGKHFPDTNPKWKGANSLVFLEQLRALYANQGLQIFHIDAIVITEKPKLGPHFAAMREALAKALGIEPDQINLKAKTNEGVDAIGRGEAIAAHAVATITG
jgi:2-C-methyl-D-erythritol 2,4-cyclodiphosphate synthase